MVWRRNKVRGWPIDPDRVEFGSVVSGAGGSLSRSHVLVRYEAAPAAQLLALAEFVSRTNGAIDAGTRLGIGSLVIAPVLKQRHEEFFGPLTDWTPATRRAIGARSSESASPTGWERTLSSVTRPQG